MPTLHLGRGHFVSGCHAGYVHKIDWAVCLKKTDIVTHILERIFSAHAYPVADGNCPVGRLSFQL